VSGSEIAWDLDRPSGPTTADRNFLHNQLHAAYAADSSGVWDFNAAGGSIFAGNASGIFDNGSKGIYLVGFPDVLTPTGSGAIAAINYNGGPAGAAAVVYSGSSGGGKVVYLGFPFETITSASVRNDYMADILNFFGALPLKFESISLLPGNQVKLVLSGATGIYTLQIATNLGAWTPLTNLTNSSGVFEFVDGAVTNQSARFYRARSWP